MTHASFVRLQKLGITIPLFTKSVSKTNAGGGGGEGLISVFFTRANRPIFHPSNKLLWTAWQIERGGVFGMNSE